MACGRAICLSICRRAALRLLPLRGAEFRPHVAPAPSRPQEGIIAHSRHLRRGLSFQASGVDQEAKTDSVLSSIKDGGSSERWRIKMLFDGECPLCMIEVNMLRKRNELHETIKFIDISSEDYKPEDHGGIDYETAMGRIHAILSDGTVVRDVEATRKLYEEVGLGLLFAVTKYEPVASIASVVYDVWAKYRLQIAGRPPLEEILASRKKHLGKLCREENACKM